LYDRLRNEAPIYQFDERVYVLTRYNDIKQVRLDPTIISPESSIAKQDGRFDLLSQENMTELQEILDFNLLMLTHHDGEFHRQYRSALQRAFIPKVVAQWPAQVQDIVDRELDAIAADGVVDLIQFAYRVPLLVIMYLLGAPMEDAERAKHWGDVLLAAQSTLPLDPDLVHRGAVVLREYTEYAQQMIARLKDVPEEERTSVIALLLAAESSDRLSNEQIVATFMHFLFAGHETTTNMIGNGMLWILHNREQWELLASDPAKHASNAVEESLRYEAPSQIKLRETTEPVEIGGVPIDGGVSLSMISAAANRDPEIFENPNKFDITRGRSDHASLGQGRHYCLGAPLARLEGQVAFETLARRYPDMELAARPEELAWGTHPRLRGLQALPVRLGPRRN
jgi:cytochrome P450